MTLRNKLYYVRTGFRRGALQMPIGATSPKYLLLHNCSNRYLYAMVEDHPKVMSGSELSHLGFAPSGNEYLTFKLKTAECINLECLNLADVKFRGNKRDIAIPYIANMQELF